MSTWTEIADKVILQAVHELSETITDNNELFKKISKEYYPFGPRQYYPYKAWIKAINKHKNKEKRKHLGNQLPEVNPNQIAMFAEVTP